MDISLIAGQAALGDRPEMFYRGDPDRVTLVTGPPESGATCRTQGTRRQTEAHPTDLAL